MPEDITVNHELGIIEVNSHGRVSNKDSLASLETLEKLMQETGIKKVLADTRKQESTPSIGDIYSFGAHLPRTMRLAMIVSKDQPTAADVTFVSDVAFNRGVNVEVFHSRTEALEWLENK